MPLLFFNKPTPAVEKLKGKPMPAHTVNPWSKLVLSWPARVFKVARSRQLTDDDMWDIEPTGQCKLKADQIMGAFQLRVPPSRRTEGYREDTSEKRHVGIALSPDQSRTTTIAAGGLTCPAETSSNASSSTDRRTDLVRRYGKRKAEHVLSGKFAEEDGKVYDQSLMTAVYHVYAKDFWWAVLLCILGYGVPMALPLLTKGIFDNISDARPDGQTGTRPVGATIGFAVGLLVMMLFGEFCNTHTRRVSNTMGLILRGAIMDMISRKSMRLTTKARRIYPDGKINAMLAADASVAEWAFTDCIQTISYPVVILIGIALIIHTIGVAGLAGIGVLALTAPIQTWLFKALIRARLLQLAALDERTKTLTEVVRNLYAIKLYAYEPLFGKVIQKKRETEAKHARTRTITRSLGDIIGTVAPPIAAVVTFSVYTAMGNELSLGTTFATLSLFLFIQKPFNVLPRFVATLSNTVISSGRLSQFFVAEERQSSLHIDQSSLYALGVNAAFEHEVSDDTAGGLSLGKVPELEKTVRPGFAMEDISLQVSRGQLVCIVGRVGTGKTTLLDGLLGEVKRSQGQVTFGGTCGYVPQEAWVQSGSIRSNITFAAPFAADESRLANVIRASALDEDLRSMAEGVDTQIGERGINLSGGQKQRICIARAAYAESDVVLLDDPLSAVDAQVGRHILHNCILTGPLADRTRILVTHHLEVLPYANHIVVMDSDGSVGRIVQQGSYPELLAQDGSFQQLVRDFGSTETDVQIPVNVAAQDEHVKEHEKQEKQEGKAFIEEEERETGSISLSTWTFWLRSMGSPALVIAAFLGYMIAQGSQIVHAFFLAQWQSNAYPQLSQGAYQGIYAGIGVLCALLSFASTALFIVLVIKGSVWACITALHRIMGSPMSFLNRTPTGRIVNRLTKDVETIDLYFAHTMHMGLVAGLGFLGTIGLYYLIFSRSQPANRDVKRLSSVMRSRIYSGLSEQLTGSAIIRAFGRTAQFEQDLQVTIDEENRFTLFREYSTGWLTIRISCALLVMPFAVALYGALDDSISPARFALTLTFVLRSVYALTDVMPWISDIEQEMNALERLKHYCHLDQEAPSTLPTDPDASKWPTHGAISFRDVEFKYRSELPLVLRGLTFDVKPGENVGIVGRTGAGKSSMLQAIERTVELAGGQICIDGVDLKSLGLHTMRSRLAIIPQSPFCFSGTVRQNIDPEESHTDAKLNDALALIHSSPFASIGIREKFKLDIEVESEGSNFSAGERQLLALIRALIRGNKILILDEATSSVDPETDALVQRIIQKEFADVTLLSIAHRLQTVAYYDRILVLEAGRVAEYDTPLNLFDRPDSIFRRTCDVKRISRQDLVDIQAAAKDV